eukprot:4102287-Pyramimonas_sp.AAC.1
MVMVMAMVRCDRDVGKNVSEKGGCCIKVSLTIDAESIFCPVQTYRSRQSGYYSGIKWCDTRDMKTDGQTKGSIDREFLLQTMSGHQPFRHGIRG